MVVSGVESGREVSEVLLLGKELVAGSGAGEVDEDVWRTLLMAWRLAGSEVDIETWSRRVLSFVRFRFSAAVASSWTICEFQICREGEMLERWIYLT